MALQPAPHLVAHFGQVGRQAGTVVGILDKSSFGADRLAYAVGHHLAVVDATGVAVVEAARLAELPHERGPVPLPQVGPGEDTQGVHLLSRHLADAEKAFDGERGDKGLDLSRGDGEKSVGFAIVRGNLGQHLVDRYPGRGRELRLGQNAAFDFAGHQCGRPFVRHVEKSLVERQRFDEVGIVGKDLAYLHRHRLVHLVPRFHEDELGTEPSRLGRRECRVHPIGSRLVAGRGYHSPRTTVPHGNRLAPVGRVVALFHRSVEGVHVDVYDFALRHSR